MTRLSGVRAFAVRLAASDFSPLLGPLDRHGLLRRAWPFVVVALVARLMLWLPGETIVDRPALYAAGAASVVLVVTAIFVPWRRFPLWTQSLVPLGFLGVVALVRESTGGVAGYVVLVMLPVLWIALYGTLRQLVVAVVFTVLVFLVPVLAVGAPTYPAAGAVRIVLWPLTAALVGGSTYRLVAAQRARAAFVEGLLSAATEQSIVATDGEGVITVFNPGAERMSGYSASDVVGKQTPLLLHDSEQIAARAATLRVAPGFDVFAALTQEGVAHTGEWTYVRRDGSRLQVDLSVASVHDAAGALCGYVHIGTDITERLAADRLKDEFIALVSHELRTPLSSIIGYLELLLDEDGGALTPRQRQFLDVIDRNARRQLRLVSDLLFLSQVEARRIRLEPVEIDVVALARSALESAAPRAQAANVSLELRADGTPLLQGDPDRLGQVFDNLLTNAIKFTPAGGEVEVRVAEVAGEVTIDVSDTGIGIPAAEQSHLFTRFFRASSATSRAIPGIGLGLTIVSAIVAAHHGTIEVCSTEGRGTHFHISLPTASSS